ncbi:MAG: tripartite tricarboxylate transporter TctB family protein [Deltaproteobacteria bacterium]|nr:tripartite tricarboxylate transporter TctB family protein [Deltaproteobacteria bacterium]
MYIKRTKDFKSGLLFMFFGIASAVFSGTYQIGTAAKMGPGYFPFVLGGMLTLLGLVVSLRSLSRGEETRKARSLRVKPVILVLSSVILFGLLLRPLGLIFSTVILIMISSMASDEFKKKEAILSAFVLLAVVLIVFIYLLKFQIPVWPSFLTGRI